MSFLSLAVNLIIVAVGAALFSRMALSSPASGDLRLEGYIVVNSQTGRVIGTGYYRTRNACEGAAYSSNSV